MFYLDKKQLSDRDKTSDFAKPTEWADRFKLLANDTKNTALKAFYEAGVVAGSTPITDVPMVALDLETTGLDQNKNSIVSIGLIDMSLSRIRCASAQHWLIKPQTQLYSTSVMVHGITHSAVINAPDFSSIITPLLEHIKGKIIVVHHSPIERGFLNVAFQRHTGEGIEFPVIDTMALEAQFTGKATRSFWQKLVGEKKESIRLTDCRSRYNLPYYRQHNAMTDAIACAELLQAQCATYLQADTPVSQIWS